MNRKKALKSSLINLIGIVCLYGVFMLLFALNIIDTYYQQILMLVGINVIMAASLNLATGFLGELALGHAGFMSVGAYASALFVRYAVVIPEYPRFLISLLVGALVAAAVSLIVGIPALRLKGDYLAIITLGFGEIIRVIIENMGFTGGAQGMTKIPKLTSFTLVYALAVITLVILYSLIRSRHGRAIMSIRENDIASESCGINITYYRTLAFSISAAFAGVAGGLYAHLYGGIQAKVFGFNRSIEYVVMVVLGGMGSFTGSVVSAVTLTILPELLRAFSDYRMLLYSIVLIIMMIFKPSGLLGTYEFSLTRFIKNFPQNFKKLIAWFKNTPQNLKAFGKWFVSIPKKIKARFAKTKPSPKNKKDKKGEE